MLAPMDITFIVCVCVLQREMMFVSRKSVFRQRPYFFKAFSAHTF